VLEGSFDDGDFLTASNTHQIIYPSLLDVRDSFVTSECLSVPCNDQDPMLRGVNVDQDFCLFDGHRGGLPETPSRG
jgi:hypothetical protein